jgi:hypothetical protein
MAKATLGSLIKASKDLESVFFGCAVIWLLSCLGVQLCDTPRNNPDFIGFSAKLEGHKQ